MDVSISDRWTVSTDSLRNVEFYSVLTLMITREDRIQFSCSENLKKYNLCMHVQMKGDLLKKNWFGELSLEN